MIIPWRTELAFKIFFPFPTQAFLLQISCPPFIFCTPNLAPFPTWSTSSNNLLTGSQNSPSTL